MVSWGASRLPYKGSHQYYLDNPPESPCEGCPRGEDGECDGSVAGTKDCLIEENIREGQIARWEAQNEF